MISRRRFVTGLVLLPPAVALGATIHDARHLRLNIREQRVNLTGRKRWATTINNSLPGPTLRWREGETITVDVHNHLDVPSSIHWHGIILPSNMDGVPGFSFDGIEPGASFRYRFKLGQSGTYWYHSHSGFQEQTGLYGAIVIDPAHHHASHHAPQHQADRDHVIVLSDWSDESPQRIFSNLRKNSHFYNRNRRTLGDVVKDVREDGVAPTLRERQMWNTMRMSDSDISDVTGFTYTYLMNGITPGTGWQGLFAPHERIRLRFINASAMTFFDLRIPGLRMKVIASDGQNIHPVTVDDIRLGTAETVDVIVETHSEEPYAIFAQAIDRSGYALGHLTPRAGLKAAVPPLDPVPKLTHVDMGMRMAMHSGHDQHSEMHHPMTSAESRAPVEPKAPVKNDMGSQKANVHGGSTDSHHPSTHHADYGQMQTAAPRDTAMGHMSAHKQAASDTMPDLMTREIPDHPVAHPASMSGPQVDMRAEAPTYRLDDPGVGLRHLANEGRKVLTYADMARLEPVIATEPAREIILHLAGNMDRYLWSFDGVPFEDAEPIELRYGERVRFTLVNNTMMNHPVHLHGMWSELETGYAQLPRKHTVVVQPGAKTSYHVQADARGRWAYHCHLMYHMMGMFREVRVV